MNVKMIQQKIRFNLSQWAIDQKPVVIFLMLAAFVAGSLSYQKLSRNEDPPFTIKTMVVGARWPGASVTDTANLLTDKLEKKLAETPHLDYTQSYTRPGQAVIMVNLRDDTPPDQIDRIWYTVRKKISDISATLPEGVQGPFFDDEFGDTFGSIYAFRSDGFTQRELRDRVEAVRQDILDLPDIGKVNILGAQDEQIVVTFSSSRLASLGIDPSAAIDALRAQNAVSPIGTIETGEEKVSVRVSGAFASEDMLRDVTLNFGNRFIRLNSIADISRKTMDPPAASVRVNGKDVIGLAISMAKDGNILAFGRSLDERMKTIADRLPHGIDMTKVADQSTVVQDAVNGFMKTLIEAIVIVLAVSFLSLGWRAGLVITASIPLVLALTFVGMEIAGIGLQRISLGALIISLGLLVDDAMITVESMISCLEQGKSRNSAATHAYETTAFPMLTGTLVMIAGFMPIGFAASSAGEYTFSLFMVVLIALISSWIVAVLFSPILGTWILPVKIAKGHHRVGSATFAFHRIQKWILKRRKLTVVVALVALGLSLLGAGQLQQQFFPSSDRPELLISLTLPQNASREATDRRAKELEAILRSDRNVDHFITYIGSGSIRFYLPMDLQLDNDNVTETVVVAKSVEKREAVRRHIEAVLAERFPDIISRVSPLELGPPVGWPLKFRVAGPDYKQVRLLSAKVADILGRDRSTRDVNLTAGEPQKTVTIDVNQVQARALGISSESIASQVAAIYSGSTVTTVRDKDRLVDVVVKGDDTERKSVADIGNIQLRTADGSYIPVRQIASIENGMEDPIIWRRQGKPMITVQADVQDPAQAASVAARLDDELNTLRSNLPMGYSITAGGISEESAKGNSSIIAIIPMMLFVIAFLLIIQLKSFSRMGIALSMAPFGLIGVVGAMLPAGTPMGFVAQLGVIALSGMIIRNAVLLIQEIDQNIQTGMHARNAILSATRHRARPILLTACAAILGMVPIAGEIFWKPMAIAIIGGLTVATVLTLTLLPAAMSLLIQKDLKQEKKPIFA
ncbi:efflux RND transporter permease subunit [Oryzifoliimicrobium ureilyticus]|uniref:efflux RND transporter permease subunit n=1 Tax=Oryzifoliimicrobium ureilyticus TaxID=3113724 RepID=UPI0030761EFA